MSVFDLCETHCQQVPEFSRALMFSGPFSYLYSEKWVVYFWLIVFQVHIYYVPLVRPHFVGPVLSSKYHSKFGQFILALKLVWPTIINNKNMLQFLLISARGRIQCDWVRKHHMKKTALKKSHNLVTWPNIDMRPSSTFVNQYVNMLEILLISAHGRIQCDWVRKHHMKKLH